MCACVCSEKDKKIIQYNQRMDDEWKKTKRFRASSVVSTSACGGYTYIGGTHRLLRRRRSRRPSSPEFRRLTVLVRDRLWRRRRLLEIIPIYDHILKYIYTYTYITCVGPSVNFGGSRSDSLGNVIYIPTAVTTGDDGGGDWYIPVLHTLM